MTFVRNIWADLVEKRLWPVAIVLVAGIIAVPTVLAKKGTETAAVPVTPTVVTASKTTVSKPIALDTAIAGPRNRAGFKRNPFRQLFVPKAIKQAAAAPTSSATGGADGSAPTSTAPSTTAPNKPAASTATYEITLRFGEAGTMRTIRDIARLTPLPSPTNPFFVYLGPKNNGSAAVFLVSSDAKATGDGTCKPNDGSCETIEMEAGDTEFFDLTTDAGVQQYQMDLVSIKKIKASSAGAAAAAHARSSKIGSEMLEAARKDGALPSQLGWYRWDEKSGTLSDNVGNAIGG